MSAKNKDNVIAPAATDEAAAMNPAPHADNDTSAIPAFLSEPLIPAPVMLTVTAASGLCLRCGPGLGYSVREILPLGAQLKADRYALGAAWIPVTTEDGAEGFVSAPFVATPDTEGE